ncbi:MAG TPA: hypothetical protein VF832_10970, partial [Longimicrobiales bacterium]
GGWGGGLYSPKWISTTYTLLTLRDLGLPGSHRAARQGALLLLEGMLGPAGDARFTRRLEQMDLCIVGMLLSLGARYRPRDPRLARLRAHALARQMADGGWNCEERKPEGVVHGSFHTTFNILDGLQDDLEQGTAAPAGPSLAARQRALDFMLDHRLFRSHRTGAVANPVFLKYSFPPRWHDDLLRGLDFFQRVRAARDPRLGGAIALLRQKRRADGTWPLQNRYSGRTFFEMEKPGQPSRWNTLRALRVLRWWEGSGP